MRRFPCAFMLLLGVFILGGLSGCGDPRNRQEITGEVKLKGVPIADGVINFAPLDGQETGEGASIIKGRYLIPRAKGLSPGKYRVSIYAGDGSSGAGDASPDAPSVRSTGKERVPPEYNQNSKVITEVKKGGGNRFDFDIP